MELCYKESPAGDKVENEAYAKLVELDTKHGTQGSEQLLQCLLRTSRWDVIKV